jgi:hypothetical protein
MKQGPRILAIDVRRSRFGYALFEGPTCLLEWGAGMVSLSLGRRAAAKAARRRIAPLLLRYRPSALIVRRARHTIAGKSSAHGPLLSAVLRTCMELRLPVHLVSFKDVLEAFQTEHCRNKDDIAEVLARTFPEIAVRLPPRRGKWGTERPRMVIFDALAAGVTYWRRISTEFPPE